MSEAKATARTNEPTDFQELHAKGAKRFGYAWFKMNQWLVETAREYNLDCKRNDLVLSAMAYKILVNTQVNANDALLARNTKLINILKLVGDSAARHNLSPLLNYAIDAALAENKEQAE